MPKLFKDSAAANGAGSGNGLPVPQLRALRALADIGGATLARLGVGGDTMTALERAGYATFDTLDVDGVIERVWDITDTGRAALAGDTFAAAALPGKGGNLKPVKVGALVPLFGTNRKLGPEAGRLLAGTSHLTVPFAGGLSEFPWFTARTIVACDAHGALVNLYRVAASRKLGPALYRRLRRAPLAEEWLRSMQRVCLEHERLAAFQGDEPDLDWAEAYWCAAWMARNGEAGKAKEFNAGLSLRWDAGGGDSAVRVRGAAHSLLAWRKLLSRVTFICGDALGTLLEVKDDPESGVYADPPFIGPGAAYKHPFGTGDKVDPARLWKALATSLGHFRQTRVVVRCYDHPMMRELFPDGQGWRWHRFVGKKASNANAPEVLIENVRAGGQDA